MEFIDKVDSSRIGEQVKEEDGDEGSEHDKASGFRNDKGLDDLGRVLGLLRFRVATSK